LNGRKTIHPDKDELTPETDMPAVAYVRMSTDHQKYSTENQLDIIRNYATVRGLKILRVFEDFGKSGLRIKGREALQGLMAEVKSGQADFKAILVYDVSRWGRFQDADEGGYYEFECTRAGIQVHYCGEQFENDGSISSNLLKTVKRVMAGEYSRELSVKVFAGQCRLVELGYRQGGAAGYGLRRVLIDEQGNPKGQLSRGEQKSLQTDRVVLVLGPDREQDVVRRMYRMFVDARSHRFTDDELLEALSKVLKRKGVLSGLIIDEQKSLPSSSAFRHRFGSLLRAYQLIGYAPERDYTQPDVSRHLVAFVPIADIVAHKQTALGLHLINMPIRVLHGIEDTVDERAANILVKEVAHRIHEDHARLLPKQRLTEPCRPKFQVETLLVRMIRYTSPAFCKTLGVAVIAPETDLRAACYRVPSRVRPFDFCANCSSIFHEDSAAYAVHKERTAGYEVTRGPGVH
jgi:DNA invertase Pin-like site-specific DNA recombinase